MRRARPASVVPAAVVAGVVLAGAVALGQKREGGSSMEFELTSPSFSAMGEIPRRHSCEGADVSPELRWSGAPEEARSLVLIVDDPR